MILHVHSVFMNECKTYVLDVVKLGAVTAVKYVLSTADEVSLEFYELLIKSHKNMNYC